MFGAGLDTEKFFAFSPVPVTRGMFTCCAMQNHGVRMQSS